MDFRKSDDVASTTCLEKPTFWMGRWIVSKREDEMTPDPYKTSEREAEQAGSTAWVVREGCPPEQKEGRPTILPTAEEELTGSWRGSMRSELLTGSVLEDRMEGRHRH